MGESLQQNSTAAVLLSQEGQSSQQAVLAAPAPAGATPLLEELLLCPDGKVELDAWILLWHCQPCLYPDALQQVLKWSIQSSLLPKPPLQNPTEFLSCSHFFLVTVSCLRFYSKISNLSPDIWGCFEACRVQREGSEWSCDLSGWLNLFYRKLHLMTREV